MGTNGSSRDSAPNRWKTVGLLLTGCLIATMGWRSSLTGTHRAGHRSSVLSKRNEIRRLIATVKSRPFTDGEVERLIHLSDDADLVVKILALNGLGYARAASWHTRVTEVLSKHLTGRCGDGATESLVCRPWAAVGGGLLGARELAPEILPLLNEPQA
jgi:hypothetical protein